MFDPFAHEDTILEKEIDRVHMYLATLSPESDEYGKTASQLTKLYALRTSGSQISLQAQKDHAAHQLACDKQAWEQMPEEQLKFYERIDPNTALTVAGSLLTAIIVVKYEQTGVISSKVMSFMRKF